MYSPTVEDALRFVTETLAQEQHAPVLEELLSQYPILLAIASELSVHDLLNLGLACQRNWDCVTTQREPLKVSKSLARQALSCKGLCIQVQPALPEIACWLPCTQRTDVQRCQGCGVGVCETCRFRVTHGTMLTFAEKRHWWFPSRTRSGSILVNDNKECLVTSFNRHAYGQEIRTKDPASCSYEDRWLNNWLCVPCVNKDIFTTPANERRMSLAPSMDERRMSQLVS